jgi:hypothetical protein
MSVGLREKLQWNDVAMCATFLSMGYRLPKFKSWLLEFRWQGVTIYLASSPTIRGTDNATTSCWHNTYHLT